MINIKQQQQQQQQKKKQTNKKQKIPFGEIFFYISLANVMNVLLHISILILEETVNRLDQKCAPSAVIHFLIILNNQLLLDYRCN